MNCPLIKKKGVSRMQTIRYYPFVSTGKERDAETGYSYFGARYMDHELMTMWLSVDPMADKYPSISPYAYCAWNPVKLVDPDGCEIDGYYGSNNQYQWFDNHTEQSFVDENGVTWNKVTNNREAWNEAITIRIANIQGLENLGYDRSEAEHDVRLYNEENPLFTKVSHLLDPQKYITKWETAPNSDEGNAKQSPEIKSTGFSLKYYPNKGGQKRANSLGIVQTSGLGHLFEAGMEAIEREICGSKADSDSLYDMHYNNATGLIRRLNPPPVKEYQTPLFYRTGGMK
ncbi:MAG: RHS repeat-associated core domain-containing protein [Alphaproteobacteria bacterium]|nr:RHS repeat-associated core domain-containing protein [Alphaproteobacteria bacterium]